MTKTFAASVNGTAILKDKEGYYFEGMLIPYESLDMAEEFARGITSYEQPLTTNHGVKWMFEIGLKRLWFRSENGVIREKWIVINDKTGQLSFVIDGDGVIEMRRNTYYDLKNHELVFLKEDSSEFRVSLKQVESNLNIRLSKIKSERETF